MSLQKSKISLSFLPKKDGETILTLEEGAGSKFYCDEIVADFVNQALSVSLSGALESGARIKGILRNNTESCFSILKFLEVELGERDKLKSQSGIKKAIQIVEGELQKASVESTLAKESLKDILKVYAEDFDWSRELQNEALSSDPNLVKPRSHSLKRVLRMFPKKNSKSLFYELPYASISSFLSVETISDRPIENELSEKSLSGRILFLEQDPYIQVARGVPYLFIDAMALDAGDICDILCFFRIKAAGGEWQDFEGKLIRERNSTKLQLDLKSFPSGKYHATVYLKSFYTNEVVWRNVEGNDFEFNLDNTDSNEYRKFRIVEEKFSKISYSSFDSFSKWCGRHLSKRGFGKYFYLELRALGPEDRDRVFSFYSEALRKISRRNSLKAISVLKSFRLLGVSDVFMISPEGPHAMAGGLSQVISGLSAALIEEDCFVTVVSPLYHRNNGNHHASSEELIADGVEILGSTVNLTKLGTFNLKSNGVKLDVESWRRVELFEANLGKLRFIFVHNPQLTDQLYGGVSAYDAVERSVFLCRCGLEILRGQDFKCNPDVILTHDWTTGIFRPLQKFAMNEAHDGKLDVPVIHLLHNAGTAYQGRFELIEGGRNIWDVTGLPDSYLEEFLENAGGGSGIKMVNLTKGACRYNDHGIVTVSKPYAQQLASGKDAIELSTVLSSPDLPIFGISNGIPTQSVKKAAFNPNSKKSQQKEMSIEELLSLKKEKKRELQNQYGLPINESAILAVLVGRLTDQKGLSLLTEMTSQNRTVLEEMVMGSSDVQLIVAGPPCRGDKAFIEFEKLVQGLDSLTLRKCKVIFEFLPHVEALKLTAGADIFLMPSKYEPGGIAQLEALAVGTSVVAHRVGGLSTTLVQFQDSMKRTSGNSFLFDSFTGSAFLESFGEACRIMSDETKREQIVIDALNSKNDWRDRVPYYLTLFQRAVGASKILKGQGRYWESREELLSKVSVKTK